MKCVAITGTLVMLMLTSGTARASSIVDFTSALTLADPMQLGRLSRNAIPQDWTGAEPFPGVINTTTAYRYHTYLIDVGLTPFIQVDVDSVSTNTFVSAYDTSYLPNSAGLPNLGFDTHWLGDAGTSGNFFGIDPLFFQVVLPQNHSLLLVVNNTTAGNVGVGDPFHLLVEGFMDSSFTEPVPEPATVLLAGSGLVLFALRRRWHRRRLLSDPPQHGDHLSHFR